MNKVADIIVMYLLGKPNTSRVRRPGGGCGVVDWKKKKNLGNIDGEIYDSAELDCIYKVMFEICINGVKEKDLAPDWLPKRCRQYDTETGIRYDLTESKAKWSSNVLK
jgi:hypothetical protein